MNRYRNGFKPLSRLRVSTIPLKTLHWYFYDHNIFSIQNIGDKIKLTQGLWDLKYLKSKTWLQKYDLRGILWQ